MSESPKALQPQLLKQFKPFGQLDETAIKLLAEDITLQSKNRDECLFQCGEQDTEEYFLIKGTIRMLAQDGRESLIEADTEKALTALAQLRPRLYTATAVTDILFFTVDVSVLQEIQNNTGADKHKNAVDEIKQKAGDEGHALLYEFKQELATGRFILPSLPEVAVRIRERIESANTSVPDIAKLVNTDPAIAAKLIKVANSPLYRGITKYDNTVAAITRLGLATTKQLVTSFALFGLFKSQSGMFKQCMQGIWRNSVAVAANSFILARRLTPFNPEEALLAGLLHSIGEIVVVSYAEQYQELANDESRLSLVIKCLRSEVGGLILENWGFPEELILVARESDDWLRTNAGEIDLCDLIQVAQLHAVMAADESTTIPDKSAVPAYAAFVKEGLTPEMTQQVINEASEQIADLQKMLMF